MPCNSATVNYPQGQNLLIANHMDRSIYLANQKYVWAEASCNYFYGPNTFETITADKITNQITNQFLSFEKRIFCFDACYHMKAVLIM
jgi:hypothetical protein